MTTFEHSNPNALIPKITSGSLYTGSFDMTPALPPLLGGENDRLKCTSFGVEASRLISGKPLFFEGYSFMIFKKYDLYLTRLYGDYMTLPPVGERKIHPVSEIVV